MGVPNDKGRPLERPHRKRLIGLSNRCIALSENPASGTILVEIRDRRIASERYETTGFMDNCAYASKPTPATVRIA